jgi:hypothetical protein
MGEMDGYPIVALTGSEGWAAAYDEGAKLEERFPDQDAYDFIAACSENDTGPLVNSVIISHLQMIQQGERDEEAWIWFVKLQVLGKRQDHLGRQYDRTEEQWWVMTGSCDYTGWDCRSGNAWTQIEQ